MENEGTRGEELGRYEPSTTDWKIRKLGVKLCLNSFYKNVGDEYFTIKLHHRGELVDGEYKNGEIDYVDSCNTDKMSIHEISDMLKELGHDGLSILQYLVPKGHMKNDIMELRGDGDIVRMCANVPDVRIIDVFAQSKTLDELVDHWMQSPDKVANGVEPSNDAGMLNFGPCAPASNSQEDEHPIITQEIILLDGTATRGGQNMGIANSARILRQINVTKQGKCHQVNIDNNSGSDGSSDEDYTAKGFSDDDHYCKDDEWLKEGFIEEEIECGEVNAEIIINENECTGKKGKIVTTNENVQQDSDVNKQKNDGKNGMHVEDEMEEDIYDNDEANSDSENLLLNKRYKYFNAEKDMKNPKLEKGLRFTCADEFREACRNYAVNEKRAAHFKPSERTRVRAKCTSDFCNWFVFASIENATKTQDLIIKTLNLEHKNCGEVRKNPLVTANWIADTYMEKIRVNQSIPGAAIRKNIEDDFGVEISKYKAYQARKKAIDLIKGAGENQYAKLWDYAAELKRTHPETTIDILHEPFRDPGKQPRFMRFYCCLGPLKKGYLTACRPLIGVDGCHLKGAIKGQILSAVAVDPNNGWWPIAYAVVEKEAREQWEWFFTLLAKDLEIPNEGYGLTIISDRQKGLDAALFETLPNCDHRYCVQHIFCNYKKLHRGKALKDFLWKIARSTNKQLYEATLKELEEYDLEAYNWVKLKAPQPNQWCKAFFGCHTKSDMLCNNISESFNAYILEARDQPILTMLETIRVQLMQRISNRRSWVLKQPQGTSCPRIRDIVEVNVHDSRHWKSIWNGIDGYQVSGPKKMQFAVDLKKMTCTCQAWSLSGIPCVHVISAVHYKEMNPHSLVDACYSTTLFLQLYSNVLSPINGEKMWPIGEGVVLDPPKACKQAGRPKKARKRQFDEHLASSNRLRRRVIIHCKTCGRTGHNAATCKFQKIGSNKQLGEGSSNGKYPSASAPKKQTVKKRGDNVQKEKEQIQARKKGRYVSGSKWILATAEGDIEPWQPLNQQQAIQSAAGNETADELLGSIWASLEESCEIAPVQSKQSSANTKTPKSGKNSQKKKHQQGKEKKAAFELGFLDDE